MLRRFRGWRQRILSADIRDTDSILAQAAQTLDFDRPIGLVVVAIMPFISDAEDAHGLVSRLVDAVPSGSYVEVSHLASDVVPGLVELLRRHQPEDPGEVSRRCHA